MLKNYFIFSVLFIHSRFIANAMGILANHPKEKKKTCINIDVLMHFFFFASFCEHKVNNKSTYTNNERMMRSNKTNIQFFNTFQNSLNYLSTFFRSNVWLCNVVHINKIITPQRNWNPIDFVWRLLSTQTNA